MRPVQIVFDAQDPGRLATFWAAALADRGYRVPDPPDGAADWPSWLAARGVPEDHWNDASAVESTDPAQPRLFFQRVPEPKTVKNRVHLDLQAGGGPSVPPDEQRARIAASVERLTALGATFVEDRSGMGTSWAVLTDPEGNEFCT
jgi:hypothetical protein